eukprot:scaffold64990_cov68-Phaeocystis_antarctica.AAC.2
MVGVTAEALIEGEIGRLPGVGASSNHDRARALPQLQRCPPPGFDVLRRNDVQALYAEGHVAVHRGASGVAMSTGAHGEERLRAMAAHNEEAERLHAGLHLFFGSHNKRAVGAEPAEAAGAPSLIRVEDLHDTLRPHAGNFTPALARPREVLLVGRDLVSREGHGGVIFERFDAGVDSLRLTGRRWRWRRRRR